MDETTMLCLGPSLPNSECHYGGKRSRIEVDGDSVNISSATACPRGRSNSALQVLIREVTGVSMRSALQSSAASTCCRHHDGPLMFIHTFRRKKFDWVPVDHPIEFMDEVSARQWTDLIQSLLYDLPERPLHLFVVINPFGGRQKADSVWQDVVKPIFERANITSDAFRTGYRDHAVELLQQMPLEQFQGYSGIVAIGGDGLFQECLRGLLALRSRGGAWQRKAAAIRIAQVPAGSTDAVACTINGCRSAVTAALHVVLGDRAKLDVLEVRTQEGQCRYACSTASYGFIGDVLGASERLRWMGPARYDISGMMTFVNLRSYAVRLWYKSPVEPHPSRSVCCSDCPLCSEPTSNAFDAVDASISGVCVPRPSVAAVAKDSTVFTAATNSDGVSEDDRHPMVGTIDGGPQRGPLSEHQSSQCHRAFHMRGASGFGEQMISGSLRHHHDGLLIRKFEKEQEIRSHDCNPMSASDSWFGNVHLKDSVCVGEGEHWHCWEGEVSSLMIVVTPTRSDKSKHGIVPHAHLSDGRLHLVIVRRCTRWQFLRFLLSLAQGGVDESFSFVDVKEVVAWRCEELTPQGSVWNVDGELMRSQYMSARCHHGLINVFGRGPEL
uniref:DAGKc domain-containing protein n=1 Tax=Ulva partita TaxID=1605170 RepID=A0A1C9ZPR1_9CHLO|nr:hypothetical protein [Ulva partita]